MKTNILIGVTGGIAGFKALELISSLRDSDYDVFVVMTKHATQMFDEKEFEKASGHPVYTKLFDENFDYKKVLSSQKVDHIELADKLDLVIIVPATANFLAKTAHGMADDFLSTTLLATTAPVIICPAMNVHMWQNPLVQKNVSILREAGYDIIEPATGMLACGYEGPGKLPEIALIAALARKKIDELAKAQSKLLQKL